MSDITRNVPVSALSAPCTMLVAAKTESGNSPVEMIARTNTVLDHYYWGPMVHDFAGMRHADKVAINFLHTQMEAIGYIDQFSVDSEGLKLSGELVSVAENDRADELRKKHKGGIPYQASIEYPHDDLVIQYIPEGVTALVNGESFSGPLTVFREWTLTGVAVVLRGYDPHTATRMGRDVQHVDLLIQGGSAMPQATAKKEDGQPVETELQKPAESQPVTEPKTELTKPESAPVDPKEQVKTELKRYTDRFGALGATYYVDGLSFEQAIDKHARTLETQLASQQTEIGELKTKLAAVATGEEQPVSAGKQGADGAPKSTGLAAFIRIPGARNQS